MKRGYGDILKKAREAKGLKHADVHKELKISVAYLKGMEDEDAAVFEKPVYMKIFLKTYAKYLKADEREIVDLYETDPEIEIREKELKKEQNAGRSELRDEINEKTDEKNEYETGRTKEKDGKKEKSDRAEKIEFSIRNKNRIIAGAAALILIMGIIILVIAGRSPEPVSAPEAEVYNAPVSETITVVAKGKDRVWMKVKHDKEEEEFFLEKDEEKRWEDIEKIVFLVGNAGGVEFIADGDSIGTIGEEGEVINGIVFRAGKNWFIDRNQGFKNSKRPAEKSPTITESGLMY
ncbi:MAG: helix-turn-helix domain-containing protein [Candidatus Goldiibacteriota bacterium]